LYLATIKEEFKKIKIKIKIKKEKIKQKKAKKREENKNITYYIPNINTIQIYT